MKINLLIAVAVVCSVVAGFSITRHKGDNQDKSHVAEADKNVRTASKPDNPASSEVKPASSEVKSAIKWYSYNDGMALGKDKKKKVFLNFYADWCGYCRQMDNTTFKDKSVISYMNENFVPVRVNADKDIKITETYQVRGLPVSFFISEDGESIGSQPGYLPPDMLMSLLKYIHTDSFKKMNFDKFMKGM